MKSNTHSLTSASRQPAAEQAGKNGISMAPPSSTFKPAQLKAEAIQKQEEEEAAQGKGIQLQEEEEAAQGKGIQLQEEEEAAQGKGIQMQEEEKEKA
jgi:hypothetical protein